MATCWPDGFTEVLRFVFPRETRTNKYRQYVRDKSAVIQVHVCEHVCLHECMLWVREIELENTHTHTHTCSHCLQLEWISLPPRRLKSCVVRSSEGGEREQGQTGVTQAFLRERPFLVASGLLACERHRNRFFFFCAKCGMETTRVLRASDFTLR